MLICMRCQSLLEERELGEICDAVPYGEGDVDMPSGGVCPHCGAEELDIDLAYECDACGEWTSCYDLENGLCKSCVAEFLTDLQTFWDRLTSTQKEWACIHYDDWMVLDDGG